MGHYITEEEEFIRARYQLDVLEAKQAHGLMLQMSYQNMVRAIAVYRKAKKEADELYLASRKRLFNRLRKELSNTHLDHIALERAERFDHAVESGDREALRDLRSRAGSSTGSHAGMESGSSTG